MPPGIVLSSISSATEDDEHLALWLVLINKVRVWINRVASEIVFQPFASRDWRFNAR